MNVLLYMQSFQLLIAATVIGLAMVMASSRRSRSRDLDMFEPRPTLRRAPQGEASIGTHSDFEKCVVQVSQISDMARRNPAHVAAVLKSWLHDERRVPAAGLCLKAIGIEASKLVAGQLHSKDMARLGLILSDERVTYASEQQMNAAVDELHTALIAYEFTQGTGDWGFLGRLSDEGLTEVLAAEDLSGCALILFHLPASRAARIYGWLDETTRHDVVEAMFRLEKQHPSATKQIAQRIQKKAEEVLAQPEGVVAGATSWLAVVGAQLAEKDRRILLSGAEQTMDERAMAELRVKLFSFTDAGALPREILGVVLQSFKPVEIAALVASLPTGSDLLHRIESALPKQVREIVAEDAPLIRKLLTRPHTRFKAMSEMRVLRNRFEETIKSMHARGELSLLEFCTPKTTFPIENKTSEAA